MLETLCDPSASCVCTWLGLASDHLGTCAQVREAAESSGSPSGSRLRGGRCGLHTDLLPAARGGSCSHRHPQPSFDCTSSAQSRFGPTCSGKVSVGSLRKGSTWVREFHLHGELKALVHSVCVPTINLCKSSLHIWPRAATSVLLLFTAHPPPAASPDPPGLSQPCS